MSMHSEIQKACEKAKRASRLLALCGTKAKNAWILSMASSLRGEAAYILRANQKDLRGARARGLSEALIDRMALNERTLNAMADAVANIARLKDPVGEVIDIYRRPNGLVIKKVRVPIGVILIIYESRPNVTSDCAGLCLKSGNAVILRGGSEAIHSNVALYNVMNSRARRHGMPDGAITMIDSASRGLVDELLTKQGLIDLVMPRGGDALINEVTRKSRIPVIKHYKGVCHTYVDRGADLKKAEEICFNAKVQRPGVCNAMETMLVDGKVARKFLPRMLSRFHDAGVEIRACPKTMQMAEYARPASAEDWYAEYLDLILAVRVVNGVGEAIAHIAKYGSSHSDAIVTADRPTAMRFLREVDSACVYLNASTRFTDGGEFGKGAEIGISTDKIHARGPMGLEELTSYKYVIYGNGQIRR